MMVLGVDPGCRFAGFGVVNRSGRRPLVLHVEGFDADAWMAMECAPSRTQATRTNGIERRFRQLVEAYQPDAVSFERVDTVQAVKGQLGQTSATSAETMRVVGRLQSTCDAAGIQWNEVPVVTWKAHFHALSSKRERVTDKKLVERVCRALNINLAGFPLKPWIHGVEACAIATVGGAQQQHEQLRIA